MRLLVVGGSSSTLFVVDVWTRNFLMREGTPAAPGIKDRGLRSF